MSEAGAEDQSDLEWALRDLGRHIRFPRERDISRNVRTALRDYPAGRSRETPRRPGRIRLVLVAASALLVLLIVLLLAVSAGRAAALAHGQRHGLIAYIPDRQAVWTASPRPLEGLVKASMLNVDSTAASAVTALATCGTTAS